MALKFWTYLKTDKYNIGLTSKAVYVFDKQGNEVTKFSDLNYAHHGCVSHNQDLLAIKSTEGRIAVYSLEKLVLIKKFRFSKIDGGQDDNFIFSPDDKYLYNIECHVSSTKTSLSIYRTSDFSLEKRLFDEDDKLVLSWIEYDKYTDDYYLLGFLRDPKSGAASKFFVTRLCEDKLQDMKFIKESTYFSWSMAKSVEFSEFTEESYKWMFALKNIPLDEIKSKDLSLADLWKKA